MSFWIGVAAAGVSLLLAAATVGLILLLPVEVDGATAVIVFGSLWFGLFFFSLRWQKRYVRSLDWRRPRISLRADGLLTVPVTDGRTLHFKLDEPHELTFGWFEVVVTNTGGPITHTRGFMTYAILSQAGQQLFLKAEESVREARSAGWSNSTCSATPALSVRLWASDLVVLVEAVRTRRGPNEAG